jgi:hypothetical protein
VHGSVDGSVNGSVNGSVFGSVHGLSNGMPGSKPQPSHFPLNAWLNQVAGVRTAALVLTRVPLAPRFSCRRAQQRAPAPASLQSLIQHTTAAPTAPRLCCWAAP